jgi:hypothetical protein
MEMAIQFIGSSLIQSALIFGQDRAVALWLALKAPPS